MLGALAGIGAGLSALDSITGYSAKRQAELDWKQWKRQFDYAADYNTPLNQRQRMVDANFNPSLMLGGSLQNTYTPGPQMGKATVTKPGEAISSTIPLLAQYQGIANAKAQEENTRADTQLKEQEWRQNDITNPINSDFLQSRLQGQQYKNEYQRIVNANQQDVYDLSKEGLDLKNQQTKKFISQMDTRFRTDIAKDLAAIRNIKKDTQLKESQRTGITSQNILRKAQTSLTQSQDTNTRLDSAIKALEMNMRKEGTSYSDNAVMRAITRVADKFRTAFNSSNTERQVEADKQMQLIEYILDPSRGGE
jgi:hypothetical protein